MADNKYNPVYDKLIELQFIAEVRKALDQVDDDLAGGVMQQMADEMTKRPTQDHKLTTMAKWLIVLRKARKNE